MGIRTASILLVVLAALTLSTAAPASAASTLKILVVGDEAQAVMTQHEKELSDLLVAYRRKFNLQDGGLPMIAYHFNKSDERSYCESVLGVHPGHLLFAGLVESQGETDRVVFRVNNVVDADAAARRVMGEVASRLGLDASVLEGGGTSSSSGRVSLIRAATFLDQTYKTTFSPNDDYVGVYVLMHNDSPGVSHNHTLKVRFLDSGGAEPQAIPALGGPFTVAAGEDLSQVNILSRSTGNKFIGYKIKGQWLGNNAGHYDVVVEVDGRVVGRTEFSIAASNRPISFVRLFIRGFGQTNPRTTFSSSEKGVIFAVYLRNDNLSRDHRHTVYVRVTDASDRTVDTLGGTLQVAAGERLDDVDVLKRADPHQYNGLPIAGAAMGRNPGRYNVIVEVDGLVVGRSSFEVTP